MSDREILISILFFCVILALCLIYLWDRYRKETLRHPNLRDGVVFFSHNCGNITKTVKKQSYTISLAPTERLEHSKLQNRARDHVSHTPINTMLRITNYAWDLAEVLESTGHLDKLWDPVGAYHFGNGVVMVRYMERPREGVKVSEAEKDLYFATSDGHIIYFKS